jgi:hypothetical protein
MTEAPKKKMSKGCMIGLIIIGVALVIAVLSFMYLPGMLRDKMIAGLSELETEIKEVNPPGYTDDQVHSIFAGALAALDSGLVADEVAQSAIQTVVSVYSDDSLTQDDAVKILEALQMMNPNSAGIVPRDDSESSNSDMGASDSTVGNTSGGE